MCLYDSQLSNSWDTYLGGEWLSHDNFMCNNLRKQQTFFHGRCTILYSQEQCTRFQFFHMVPIYPYTHPIFLFSLPSYSYSSGWAVISLWFCYIFPKWLMMLSIFSWAYWSQVSLLQRNVSLSFFIIRFFVVVIELYNSMLKARLFTTVKGWEYKCPLAD